MIKLSYKRITELVEQGVNLAGVAQVLDLETKHGQLESDYTALTLRNAELTADRKAAQRRRAAPKKAKKDFPLLSMTALRRRLGPPAAVARLPFTRGVGWRKVSVSQSRLSS